MAFSAWGYSVVVPVRIDSSHMDILDGVLPQEGQVSASSVLKSSDVEAQQMRRLEDALRIVPGVTLGPQGGGGVPSQIFLRGVGARHVRVFIDGVEISDPSRAQAQFQGFAWGMEDVERIQVFRGPQPGRFGLDAGAGVIDIRTKKPTHPFEGQTGIEMGRYGTQRGFSRVAGMVDSVDYKVSVQGEHRDGYSDFNERRGGHEKDPYTQWSSSAALGIQATETARLEVSARYGQENQSSDHYGDENWRGDHNQQHLRATFTLDHPEHALEHSISLSDHGTYRANQGDGSTKSLFTGHRRHAGYIANWGLLPDFNVQFGADVRHDTYEQRPLDATSAVEDLQKDSFQQGAFLGVGGTPVKNLDVFASGRMDHTSATGGEQAWRLGSAYLFEDLNLTVRGNIGTSVQIPSLYERYHPCSGSSILKPEFLRGWDLGVRHNVWGQKVRWDATWFRNDVRDSIGWTSISTGLPGCSGRYQNVKKVRAQGLESSLRVQLSKKTTWRATHTWQIVTDRQTGERDKDRPRHQAAAFLDMAVTPSLHLSGSLRYRGRADRFEESTGAFLVAGVLASWTINDRVKIDGRVDNIFNRRYEERYGHGTPGRAAYVGIKVSY